MWVQRRLLEVSLMVTCDGSKGLMRALPGRTRKVGIELVFGEPTLPIIVRFGGGGEEFSWTVRAMCFTEEMNHLV